MAEGANVASADRVPSVLRALRLAARRFGTPLFVTDVAALERAASDVATAFPDPIVRQYSLKANDVGPVVERIGRLGFGANVVSGGEWAIARRAGIPNGRTTLEGIGKSRRDLRAAVLAARDRDPLLWLALESVDEAADLAAMARRAGLAADQPLDVLFRLNPDVAAETHAGLAVGGGGSKFGMTEAEIAAAIEAVGAGTGPIQPRGIHLHVGSQLAAVDAWREAARRAIALVALLRGGLPSFDTLDLGGGFPAIAVDRPGPSPARFARELPPLLAAIPADRRPARIAIEPGRFLVAAAGWLVARVLHVRERGTRLVVLDAGMTELIRPALYGAVHPVVALTSLGRAAEGLPLDAAHVEGPICESTDHLGAHALPPVARGDLVAIGEAGAYGAVLASTYNGRPRPPQVFLEPDGALRVVRRRGTAASLG